MPEINLHLAGEAVELWKRIEEELQELGLPPPFWAFAWAGGQALARYVLDHPEIVAGKSVLDFASGSGLVAIAAAMAGATEVTASEIDGFAIAAISLNAALNNVHIEIESGDIIGAAAAHDVIFAGDICYQKDIAGRVTEWLSGLAAEGKTVLIGDPGRSYLPRERLEILATYAVPVTRALEDCDIKQASVWRFKRQAN